MGQNTGEITARGKEEWEMLQAWFKHVYKHGYFPLGHKSNTQAINLASMFEAYQGERALPGGSRVIPLQGMALVLPSQMSELTRIRDMEMR